MSRLEELLEELIMLLRLVVEKDLTLDQNTIITDSSGKTKLHDDVHPVVMYDTTDGKVKNFGTWEQPQYYKGGIYIDAGLGTTWHDIIGAVNSLYITSLGHIFLSSAAGSSVKLRYGTTESAKFGALNTFSTPTYSSSSWRFSPITAPTKITDRCFLYGKDVGGKAHVFAMDEDGNEFDLTV